MMSLLYALGQHQALRSVQSQLRPSEGLLAFHDDIYIVTSPERTCEVHIILRGGFVGQRAGVVPRDFDKLLRVAGLVDPHAKTLVWGFGSTARGTWHLMRTSAHIFPCTWEVLVFAVHPVLHMLRIGAVGPIAWQPFARATSMWLLHCQTHQLQPLILLVLPTAVICSLMLVLS